MKLQCKDCGRIINAPLTAIADGSDCSECGGKFKLAKKSGNSNGDSYLPKNLFKYILLGVAILFGIIILFSSFYTINAGERGVILTFGKPSEISSTEGFHFKIPIAQKVIKMDVKTQKYEAESSAASKDLQVVSAKIAVNYHLVPETIPELYKTIGIAYQDRVIQPTVQEVVKASTAQFTAEELITRWPKVKIKIKELLIERLRGRGIIVEDISITNFDFSDSFNAAIEAKVTAEHLKLKAERDLQRIEIEAQQKIASAQAEAESIRIQSEALKSNKEILELRAIEKWDGILPKVTGNTIPFIDITSQIQ